MASIEDLRKILDGDFSGVQTAEHRPVGNRGSEEHGSESGPSPDSQLHKALAEEYEPSDLVHEWKPPEFDVSGVGYDPLAKLFQELLDQGKFLQALSCLKLCGHSDGDGLEVMPLIKLALNIRDPESISEALSSDPIPGEFLGTRRSHIAWSVMCRDPLSIQALPESGAVSPSEWIISQDPTARDGAPHGLALVWWSKTEVAGKLRPKGTRRFARQKLELTTTIHLLGQTARNTAVQKIPAEVSDLSSTGTGLHIVDSLGRYRGLDMKGERIRLEITVPNQEPLSTLAIIRWAKAVTSEGMAGFDMGVQFIDPPTEFVDGIEEMLAGGQGDIQYLWSLFESRTGKP